MRPRLQFIASMVFLAFAGSILMMVLGWILAPVLWGGEPMGRVWL